MSVGSHPLERPENFCALADGVAPAHQKMLQAGITVDAMIHNRDKVREARLRLESQGRVSSIVW